MRISLSAEACFAIGHDDAIGSALVGSEWIAMRIRGSRPLRDGPETGESISVGRFRPVAVTGGVVAAFRGAVLDCAKRGRKWCARRDSNSGPPA